MDKEYVNSLFRMSAVVYANNDTTIISREQIIKKYVEDVLLTSGKPMLISDIQNSIDSSHKLYISDSEIKDIVTSNKHHESFDLNYPNGELEIRLTKKRMIFLTNNRQKTLDEYIDEYLALNSLGFCNKDIFYRYFYNVFATNLEGYKRLLQEDLHANDEDDFSDEEKEMINTFLEEKDEGKSRAIYNFASYALEYCMLTNTKKTLPNTDILKNKILFLDSNIIFRVLGLNGEDRKKRARLFLSKFKNVNQHLAITANTQDEFLDTFNYKIQEIEKFLSDSPNLHPLVFSESAQEDDVFKVYCQWKVGKQMNSPNYFKQLVLSEFDKVKEDYGILVESQCPYDEFEEDEKFKDMVSDIKRYDPDKTHFAAEKDAKNLMWIDSLRRKDNATDLSNSKYFFISSDHNLRFYDYYRNQASVPVVMLPSQWLSMLLRYLNRTDDDYESFVSFIKMKTHSPLLTNERLVYIINGISQVSNDISQQKHLLKNIISNDGFLSKYQDVETLELASKAKEFAESIIAKENKDLKKQNEQQNEQIKALIEENKTNKQVISGKEIELENTKATSISKDEYIKVIEESSNKDKKIAKLELNNWRRPRLLITTVMLSVWVFILSLCFICQSKSWNLISFLINWIDSLSGTRNVLAYSIVVFVWSAIATFLFRVIVIMKKLSIVPKTKYWPIKLFWKFCEDKIKD